MEVEVSMEEWKLPWKSRKLLPLPWKLLSLPWKLPQLPWKLPALPWKRLDASMEAM